MTARFTDFVPAYHNSGPVPNNAYRTGAVVRGYGPHRDWAIDVRRRLSLTALPANDLEFMHGVIAKCCTPAQQLTGVPLPNADHVIGRLLEVREACLASLATQLRVS